MGINERIKSLANYYDVKYNDSPRYELLQTYASSVSKGKLSPIAGFDLYEDYHAEIESELVGKTVNGVTITGQSKHFLERVFGCMQDPKTGLPRSGAEIGDVIAAVDSPIRTDPIKRSRDGRKSIAVYSSKAKVTINPDTGQLIQTNRWVQKMIKMSDVAKAFIKKELPELLDCDDISCFLDKLDDMITYKGFDQEYAFNAFGAEAQHYYDEIYDMNVE